MKPRPSGEAVSTSYRPSSTSSADADRELVRQVGGLVPTGPTHFIRAPVFVEADRLEDDLHRIRAAAAVPVGREWLAEDLLPTLVRERAPDDLLVHGPVVMYADEHVERRFARDQDSSRRAAEQRVAGLVPTVIDDRRVST